MAVRAQRPSTTELVLKDLRGSRVDVRDIAFQGMLLVSLLLSLSVLIVLLVEVTAGSIEVFSSRGIGFLRANVSSLPQLAGVAQGISGSLMLMAFVVLFAFPIGIGAAVYLEEY